MNAIFAIAGVAIKEIYRRKDFYVLFVLSAVITLIAGSANFFHDDRVGRYLKELCLVLIWISAGIITVTTAARQIPAERESRTLFPLLAKPVTRSQVVAGKFFGCWLATGLCLVVFYLFFVVVNATREHAWPTVNYLQAIWMQWMMLGIVGAMTILGSIVFAAPSSNSTICFTIIVTILVLGGYLHRVAIQLPEPTRSILSVAYFLIPHLEWFFDVKDSVIHEQAPIAWWAIGVATLYAATYMAIFLSAACVLFRRKALN